MAFTTRSLFPPLLVRAGDVGLGALGQWSKTNSELHVETSR